MLTWFIYALVALVIWVFFQLVRVVPTQQSWVLEELGKFKKALEPGLHFVVPFVQKIAYKHTLKEQVLTVKPQVCITQDNVQVEVDGVLYLRVIDPVQASYGIENYGWATTQLAQTTMRSEIGKIALDKTFCERDKINASVVKSIDTASEPWGVKVTRYEIRDIEPAKSVIDAMEKQVVAERAKRAEILESEGEKEARINVSKGEREEAINLSRGERQKRINEAEGRAISIETVTTATAEGLRMVAEALSKTNGRKAMNLQVADQYFPQLGRLLGSSEVQVLPLELAQVKSSLSAVLPSLGFGQGGKA
ncbi:MAG: paraslipin [Spirochaetales bacterium]|nr:paraslipin [Spirochaetales bacterium]